MSRLARPSIVLLAGLIAAFASYAACYLHNTATHRAMLKSNQPELAWLQQEFQLGNAEFHRIAELHEAYRPRCEAMCRRIQERKHQLADSLEHHPNWTEEDDRLLSEIAQLRLECYRSMLRHFLEVSRAMPPEQGQALSLLGPVENAPRRGGHGAASSPALNSAPAPPSRDDASEDAEDRRCMERLQRGDDQALNELMARHADRLTAYLFRLLQDLAEAEDLAEESFVRVYTHRSRFDTSRLFRPWLYTVATNLSRDRLRWKHRHPHLSLDHVPPTGTPIGDTLQDPMAPPDDRLGLQERAQAVRNAIGELPEDLRIPIVLAEYEDRSLADIATILKCSPKAAEMRLYRARQRLRITLQRFLASA